MPNLNSPGADPFEDFAAQAEGAPLIDPSEVRNLGNRRRTRRHMTVGASTFVVVLMASVIAISQSGAVGQRDPDVAANPSTTPPPSATVTASASTPSSAPSQTPSRTTTPTASSTPTPTPSTTPTASPSGENTPTGSAPDSASPVAFGPVTAKHLPSSELVANATWKAETVVGWDDTEQSCGPVNVLAAQHVHRRFWVGTDNAGGTAYVMDFATADQATAAATAIAEGYRQCTTDTLSYETEPAPLTTAPQESPVTPVSARAHRMRPSDNAYQPGVNGLVIQVGTRLMWVDIVAWDAALCSVGPTLETCPVYNNANDMALLLMSP